MDSVAAEYQNAVRKLADEGKRFRVRDETHMRLVLKTKQVGIP